MQVAATDGSIQCEDTFHHQVATVRAIMLEGL